LRLKTSHIATNGNEDPGIGNITTNGMICTCQGSSCSCIGKSEAHCVSEEEEKCIESEALVNNGIYKRTLLLK
jgi:hypothetical protein